MGDKIDHSLEFGRAGEGRQKSPPHQRKILIAHVEGGSAAHNSSMTSSLTDSLSEWEGRDEEPIVAFSLVCDWTMNSWVFRQYRSCLQSQSIMHFATLTVTEHTEDATIHFLVLALASIDLDGAHLRRRMRTLRSSENDFTLNKGRRL